jgi:hypothetical protein
MPTTDVSVFDGSEWVSLKGTDGTPGDAGKSFEIANQNATTVEPSGGTFGTATLSLTPNAGASTDEWNAYDITMGIPAGLKGDQGEPGVGVNILGDKPTEADLPASGSPGDGWLVDGDLWVWDATTSAWINAGSIQGPAGPSGDLKLLSTVALSEKLCGDFTATASLAEQPGSSASDRTYQLSLALPRPVKVTVGSVEPTADICAGDFFIETS